MARTRTSTSSRDAIGGLRARLPERVRSVIDSLRESAREDDILLYSSGLAFYALVSVAPLIIIVMWIAGTVLGEERVQQAAEEVKRLAPEKLGADQALTKVTQLGTQIGVWAIVTGLWPATAYGAGLSRAFTRLSHERGHEMKGLRGRALALVVLLPVLVLGGLLGSYAGSAIFGESGVARVAGLIAALVTGFAGAAAGLALIYRIFPPERLSWRRIALATGIAAGGVSVLSLLFTLYLNVGADFKSHYVTSGLAGVVLLAVWLFLSNLMLLVGYKIAATDAKK